MTKDPIREVRDAARAALAAGRTLARDAAEDPVGTARLAASEARGLADTAVAALPRVALGARNLRTKVRDNLSAHGHAGPSTAPAASGYDPTAVEEAQAEADLLAGPDEDLGPFAEADEIVLDRDLGTDEGSADPDEPAPAAAPAPARGTARAKGGGKTTPTARQKPAPRARAADTLPDGGTPLHGGRDGHREVDLPAEVSAAVEEAPSGASLAAAELPVENYPGLSLAQLRGRLPKLDAVQLAQLRDYERAHADRASVVTLLENRLAKVAASSTALDAPAEPVPAPVPDSNGPAATSPVSPATDRGDNATEVGGKPTRDPRA